MTKMEVVKKLTQSRWCVFLFVGFCIWYIFDYGHIRPIVQTVWTSDLWVIANAGYRLLDGQWPHVDYFAPVSLTFSALIGWGLWVKDLHIEGLYFSMECAALALSVLMFVLTHRRFGLLAGLSLSFLVLETCVSLRPIAFQPSLVAPSGAYNKIGWALLMLTFVCSFFPDKKENPTDLWKSWLVGFCGFLLLFLKTNFFIAWGLLFAGSFLFQRRKHLPRSLLGLALPVLLVFLFTPITVKDFILDAYNVGLASSTQTKLQMFGTGLSGNQDIILAVALFTAGLSFFARKDGAWRPVLAFLIFCASALVAGVGAIGDKEFPLFYILPLLGWAYPSPPFIRTISTFVLIALPLNFLNKNIENYEIRHLLVQDLKQGSRYYSPALPRLKDYHFLPDEEQALTPFMLAYLKAPHEEYKLAPATEVFWIEQANVLLNAISDKSLRVTTLTWTNYVAYSSGFRMPLDDALFYHLGRVMNDRSLPPAEKALGSVDILIVPKMKVDETQKWMEKAYSNYILMNFRPTSENELWTLLTRTTSKRR